MTVPEPQPKMVSAELIEQTVQEVISQLEASTTLSELKQVRNRAFAEGSVLAEAKKSIKHAPPADRAALGKLVGGAKGQIERTVAERNTVLEAEAEARLLRDEAVDVTIDAARRLPGGRHPLELVMEEVADFFSSMGWQIGEGPEIEHEWFNFDALNLDPDHPARQMQDTLYVDPSSIGAGDADASHLVMRTHTSPVQARVMTTQEPPIYLACPGKVFRSDELDQTHSSVFHQVEGLAIDKNLTMAHLKGTLDAFARHMFGPEAKTRLRPSFFPFTEPSAEMDLWFPLKKGGPGWIEWGGCGMVNPNVLIACGIDPDVYQGFAFGMGIERTLMLRHGISDMHDIVEGDVRFSQQFGITGKGK